MKQVSILAHGQVIRGLWNVKAGLVSYVFEGHIEYVGVDCIVPAILSKQAF